VEIYANTPLSLSNYESRHPLPQSLSQHRHCISPPPQPPPTPPCESIHARVSPSRETNSPPRACASPKAGWTQSICPHHRKPAESNPSTCIAGRSWIQERARCRRIHVAQKPAIGPKLSRGTNFYTKLAYFIKLTFGMIDIYFIYYLPRLAK
jgi:hypothetical protein